MREELIEKLLMLCQRHGWELDGVREELTILLNDYEVTVRETALSVSGEDKNDQYLRRFLIAKTVKGCTERTLAQYRLTLRNILSQIGKPVDEITADDIRYYLALRDRRDQVSKTTQDNERRYLRTFFTYLQGEELITRNPMTRVDAIRAGKHQKEAFSELDVERLRAACSSPRESALVEVLLSTGCRVSELVQIKIKEIAGDSVVLHGKGDKDRTSYLNAKAMLAIERYLSSRNDDNPYLFGRQRRRNDAAADREPMGTSRVSDILRELGRRGHVEHVHPHRFRRTCATFALRRGMPLEQVSKLLGHEQLTTTQVYLDLGEEELEQAHKKYVL